MSGASRAAVTEARLRLARSGLTDVLCAVAVDTDTPCFPHVEAVEVGLLSIAYYLGSSDPLEIAAAAILEATGHQRSQLAFEGLLTAAALDSQTQSRTPSACPGVCNVEPAAGGLAQAREMHRDRDHSFARGRNAG